MGTKDELEEEHPQKKMTKSERKQAKYKDDIDNYSVEHSSRIRKDEGIYKDRGCTDLFCLIVFLAFMGTMMGLTIHGFIEGNPEKYISPYDRDSQFCGHDEAVKDYPYLYWPDMSSYSAKEFMNQGICVKECPHPELSYQHQTDPTILETGTKSYPGVVGNKLKLQRVYITRPVLHYCVPKLSAIKDTTAAQKWKTAYDAFLKNPVGQQFNNMYLASTSIYLSCFMALVFCLVYIKIMSLFAETIAWAMVVLV